MAQSTRTRLLRVSRPEQEIHVITNPSDVTNASLQVPAGKSRTSKSRTSKSPSPSSSSRGSRKRLTEPDYHAPQTAAALRQKSRWLIVRRNLHRIRFMGYNERGRDKSVPDFYIGLQMKRELKRAQEEIKNIDKEENFYAVKHFKLAVDETRIKDYDTSHVKPGDALIYDRLGEEPLALQNLLYYFSKQDVPHGTVFWDFLNEVNSVLNMQRKRTVLIQRLRKLALTLSLILYTIIGLMLFLLIVSVITTATKMNDPEVKWLEPNVDKSTSKLLSI
ncbi:unnamed protein product [Adineta steineri]|uniref:Uncharacterized protein n=1 Tax=Adineta steineri TaxID=433720 RepID=A0A818TDV1_9BILA|nr:unnamed protein product [Adineta steineri]CAF1200412.1 unnamed protein product [Adineta steineri]CAF3531407.1 unnamed protein product [Adineta steineri]CAF3685785.1 unnamed protein product [Adineta steineri]